MLFSCNYRFSYARAQVRGLMHARPHGYMNTLPQKAARQEYIDKQGSRGSEQNLARKVQVSGMNFCVHRIVSDRRVRLRSMHACLKVLPPSTTIYLTLQHLLSGDACAANSRRSCLSVKLASKRTRRLGLHVVLPACLRVESKNPPSLRWT